eukprot:59524-Pelagomonas_calceolata.AAC.5
MEVHAHAPLEGVTLWASLRLRSRIAPARPWLWLRRHDSDRRRISGCEQSQKGEPDGCESHKGEPDGCKQ